MKLYHFLSVYLLVSLILLGSTSSALANGVFGIQPDFKTRPVGYGDGKAVPLMTPSWSQWDLKPFVLRIPKSLVQSEVLAFGVNCTSGSICNSGFAASAIHLVRLIVRGDNLLLVAADDVNASNNPALSPVARWKIVASDPNHLLVTPDLGQNLAFATDYDSLENQSTVKIHDRFFHDFREADQGIWFHETVRYEAVTEASEDNPRAGSHKGADTFTVFLLNDPFTPNFESRTAIESVGYFVASDEDQGLIYGQRNQGKPFNPKQLKALRWARGKTIEWVIDSRCPEAIFPTVKQGIEAWNSHLKDVQLVARKALPHEELDTPFLNVLYYEPGEGLRGGVANSSHNPKTGEIFRAAVKIEGPAEIKDSKNPATGTTTDDIEKQKDKFQLKLPYLAIDFGGLTLRSVQEQFTNPFKSVSPLSALTASEQRTALSGVVSHEIGHTLALRHNFRGHSYVENLEDFPTGSSVMDYPKYFQYMKIGPYDDEAIGWGYNDTEPTGKYPFCTDEKAGWTFMLLANDPECQRWAVPTDKFFETNYKEAHALVHDLLPVGLYETANDFSIFDLGLVFSYIRNPSNGHFNKYQFAKAYDLIGAMAELPETSQLLGNYPYWASVLVVTTGLSSQFGTDVLSPRTIYSNSANMDKLFDWISRYPGKENIDLRKKVVMTIKGWAADPFGFSLYEKLKTRLKQEAQSSANMDVRTENTFLLNELEK